MKNIELEQFLDTGWYTEATLFLNGYIYWCEAQSNNETGMTQFFVDKWKAINENDTIYHSVTERDGTLQWERIYDVQDTDPDLIKKKFLEAQLFDGKTFWQVKKDILWLEEGAPVKDENYKEE